MRVVSGEQELLHSKVSRQFFVCGFESLDIFSVHNTQPLHVEWQQLSISIYTQNHGPVW